MNKLNDIQDGSANTNGGGNTGGGFAPVPKKPFYKQVWFWAVVAIVGLWVAGKVVGKQ